jgi:hypothetical protein
VGDKGMRPFRLQQTTGSHVRDFKRSEPFIHKSFGHHAERIHECKTGAPTSCNFECAGWLTEANHLVNIASRAGKKLEWRLQEPPRDERARDRAADSPQVSQGLEANLNT